MGMSSTPEEQDRILWAIYIGRLLYKHADGQPLDSKEQADLQEWQQSSSERGKLFRGSTDRSAIAAELRSLKDQYDTEKATVDIFNALNLPTISRVRPIPKRSYVIRWSVAAALTGVIVIGTWMLINTPRQGKLRTVQQAPPGNDILPGSSKAILILGNGERVTLDKTKNGQLARQGNVTIVNKDGRLVYQGSATDDKVMYNTIATPKGGQYQLVLPDGSKVWLNAASSIRYPTAFTGAQRKVELTGEAYFEIAQNKQQPFIVQARELTVSVLGTDFDVMAYSDEGALHTTLLKGSVMVGQGPQSKLLAPGQQAIVKTNLPIAIRSDVDVEKAIAWKTGFFMFNNTDIKTLMREISRWYDIEVDYEITDFSGAYGGRISRSSTLLQLKQLLEGNGIYHYKIEGRRLVVLP
jgi:ferric-dicitrate binding protein FerR (iron transport regulator)